MQWHGSTHVPWWKMVPWHLLWVVWFKFFSHSKHRFFSQGFRGQICGCCQVTVAIMADPEAVLYHGIPTPRKNMSSSMGRMTYHTHTHTYIYIYTYIIYIYIHEIENKTYLKPPTRPYLFHTSSKRWFSIDLTMAIMAIMAVQDTGSKCHHWPRVHPPWLARRRRAVFSGSKRSWASWECAGGLYGYDLLW